MNNRRGRGLRNADYHLQKGFEGPFRTNPREEVCLEGSAAGHLIREQLDGNRKRNAKNPVAIYYPSEGQDPRTGTVITSSKWVSHFNFLRTGFCWGPAVSSPL